MTSRASHDRSVGPTTLYRETMYTPWWWYLLALFAVGILTLELHFSTLHLAGWISLCVLIPLFAVLLWSLGHWRVEVRVDEQTARAELRVRNAHIELHALAGVVALDAATLRRVVGREGDPAAFVTIRPWIGPGLQLWLDDPDDPTPYWVISSRRPRQLLDVIRDNS